MASYVVLQWYYDGRDGQPVFPELTATFGPFQDKCAATEWVKKASDWGGWGRYEYQIEELLSTSG